MKTTTPFARRPTVVILRLALVASAVLLWRAAAGFDTGHHFDMTETVTREQGFGDTSVKVVQVSNWLTDFYSARPLSRDEVRTGLSKLHFDNLYTTEDVARYWGRLMQNAREATREAAESDDPLAMLALTGMLLHAVQDFGSHSNWVEAHRSNPGAPYRRETWLAGGAPEGEKIFTGSYPPYPIPPPESHREHGDYDFGVNKDSHVRPMWAEAYVFAYCATEEVLQTLRGWAEEVRPGFWAEVTAYRLDDAAQKRLDRDVKAVRNLSMWVKGKGSEGHWKGAESGSARYLSLLAVEWTSSPASVVVQEIKKGGIQEKLAAGLYAVESPAPMPAISGFRGDRVVVEIGITYVAEKRGDGGRIDLARNADLFAVTTVGAQRYVDRVLRGKRRYSNPWLTIHLADAGATEIPIKLEVWNQEETHRRDDLCDINPVEGKRVLNFTVRVADDRLGGDVEGLFDSPEKTFEIGGARPDDMQVLIRGYVRTRRLASF